VRRGCRFITLQITFKELRKPGGGGQIAGKTPLLYFIIEAINNPLLKSLNQNSFLNFKRCS
jgi:hypothetical protein